MEGKTEACYSRDIALNLAYTSARNAGNKECNELGPQWRWQGIEFKGYEQCKQCGTSNEYRCTVTQAVHVCIARR